MATRGKTKPEATSGPLKWVLLGAGFLALGLGLVGLFLPIVPSVPFLVVAGFCFARSSKRLHERLLDNKYFGPTLKAWEERGELPARTKYFGIAFLILGLGTSIVLFVRPLWLQAAFAATGLAIAAWMSRIPVAK